MPFDTSRSAPPALIDSFGRAVTYLRLSLTDRCDLRCTYCMAENMVFLPKRDLLSIEELAHLSEIFIQRGVRKLRLTGGEPLVRNGVMDLISDLSRHLRSGALDELTLTTNGTQLARYADDLFRHGVRRVNVSLDTLDPDRYRQITRLGTLDTVLDGLDAAQAAGLRIKLNAVASRGAFEAELDDMIRFAHGRGMDLTLIEEMPLGDTGQNRADTYLSIENIRASLSQRWTLTPLAHSTGGPARYLHVAETGGRLGLIAPMSCNFCTACNRVRLGATGRLYTCLGQEGSVNLRPALAQGDVALDALLRQTILQKPKGHDFDACNLSRPAVRRFMSALGG